MNQYDEEPDSSAYRLPGLDYPDEEGDSVEGSGERKPPPSSETVDHSGLDSDPEPVFPDDPDPEDGSGEEDIPATDPASRVDYPVDQGRVLPPGLRSYKRGDEKPSERREEVQEVYEAQPSAEGRGAASGGEAGAQEEGIESLKRQWPAIFGPPEEAEPNGDKTGSRVGAGARAGKTPAKPIAPSGQEGHPQEPPQDVPQDSSSGSSVSGSSSSFVGGSSLWLTNYREEENTGASKDRPSDALIADLRVHLGDERATRWDRHLRLVYNFERPVTDLRRAIRIRRREVVWSWESWQIEKAPIPKRVHEAILRLACGDPILRRYVTFSLVSDWRDEGTGELCFPWQAAAWVYSGEVSRKKLYDKTTEDGIGNAGDLIEYLREKLPGELETRKAISKRRVTLLKETGLPTELVELHREELKKKTDAVYAGSGEEFDKDSATELRETLKAKAARMHFPSSTATRIADHLNALPARRFTEQFQDRIDEARAYVEEMEIDVELSEDKLEGLSPTERARKQEEANEAQRKEYLKVLKHIEHQAKPYYRPSRKSRTDRIFSLGRSILILPGSVRKILCEGLYEVDLVSAHLILAAWLWNAESVLERLTEDGFDLWQELIGYFEEEITERFGEMPEPGSKLWKDVKSALKIALYSTVYGMYAPSVKAKFTRRMKGLLGDSGKETGRKLGRHPLIADLLKARDEQLAKLEVGDTLTGPTDIEVKITQPMDSDGDGVDAKSAMATIAQSCEQYLMEAILDYIAELDVKQSRRHMKLYLWLHDGAYLDMRSPRARGKGLQRHLERRAEELLEWAEEQDAWDADGLPPVAFDITEIE